MVVGVSPKQWQALVEVTGTESAIDALQVQMALDFNKEGDRFQAREQIRELFAPIADQRYIIPRTEVDPLHRRGDRQPEQAEQRRHQVQG